MRNPTVLVLSVPRGTIEQAGKQVHILVPNVQHLVVEHSTNPQLVPLPQIECVPPVIVHVLHVVLTLLLVVLLV